MTEFVENAQKPHLGIVIVGHVDAGKSTTTGHLLFKLGGLKPRVLENLKKEAAQLGKQSFEFAFFMDKQKEERERGVTISCTTKEFFTPNYHYTIIDAPGHKDFIKNMISGASQADVALLMVPATKGSFETSIQRSNHKEGRVQGQTRQHAKLCHLLGIEQLIVGINKMDGADYSEARYMEIKEEVTKMLKGIGWRVKKIPFIPMSGLQGENLDKISEHMPWYKGFEVPIRKGVKVKGHTLIDALTNVAQVPQRKENLPFRMPVSGMLKIPGIGDVITGRVEQGEIKKGSVLKFAPRNTTGKCFSIEMHHRQVEKAQAGDNIGINVKGLDKGNMPKPGDIMFMENDPHSAGEEPRPVEQFDAMVFIQDHPGELHAAKDGASRGGFTPNIHVRTARAACRLVKIHWKKGKSTNGAQVENPPFLKAGDQALVTMEPKVETPIFLETYDKCPGLGRIAGMDSNTLIMLGRIQEVRYKTSE
ncbi:MAG: elongation factor 1-alpha [Magnetovibrio sp.]|nr:elongation factor 1-alpha [Magnetovibrio sp.]